MENIVGEVACRWVQFYNAAESSVLLIMSSSQKLLVQIAFNLLLILLALVALISVLKEIFSASGDLGQALFLLIVLGVLLFVGIGFLVRLVRNAFNKENP